MGELTDQLMDMDTARSAINLLANHTRENTEAQHRARLSDPTLLLLLMLPTDFTVLMLLSPMESMLSMPQFTMLSMPQFTMLSMPPVLAHAVHAPVHHAVHAAPIVAHAAPAYHAPVVAHAAPAYHAPVKAGYVADDLAEVSPYSYTYAVADDYS